MMPDDKDEVVKSLVEALEAAKKVVDVAEGMASCRSDDEFVWAAQVQIKAALKKAKEYLS